MNKLKFIKSTLVIALGAVLLGSCMKGEDPGPPPEPSFAMSIFNGYSAAQGVMPRINGQPLFGSNASLRYDGTYSPFGSNNPNPLQFGGNQIGLSAGEYKFSVANPTTNQVLIPEFTLTTKANTYYTWFVFGEEDDEKSIVVEDAVSNEQLTAPKIRFFNLANGTGEVDVLLGEETIEEFSGRDQDDQASATQNGLFINKSSTSGNTIIVKDTDGVELKKLSNYDFRDGYYTIVLVGDPAPSTPEDAEHSYEIKVFAW